MAFRRTEGMSVIQALAMTVAEIPVFVYTTFGQLRLSPGLRKVLFATALGTVALALAAHQLKRRRRRKKQIAPEKCGFKPGGITVPILPTRRVSSVKKGMELFEEALQKWEQALTIRQRDSVSTSTPVPWDGKKQQESMSENIPEEESQRREFAEKLEALLHRAYHLQEEFGSSLPSDSMLLDLEKTLMFPLADGSLRLRTDDEDSSISEDSFFSAAENPKAFLESYEEMLRYALKQETWPTTQQELEGRGVVCMSFFDIVLDFILMDAFEDLENPPSSVLAVLRNRWLSDSFKETHQIVQYLKDMFDLDNVRYTTVQSLAEDILQLSRRRSEILLGYLGTETSPEMNGTLPGENEPLKELI
ncbi:protein fam73b [Limosa lapponica baueri]|uniref:Mitoguardin 2 n=1 Tax=Limosa lapponica baueri TaxID=1758121 RepID=A0A2I0TQ60_LIMLA|nr:protein fam73b [Limosa lapponica baueri]